MFIKVEKGLENIIMQKDMVEKIWWKSYRLAEIRQPLKKLVSGLFDLIQESDMLVHVDGSQII